MEYEENSSPEAKIVKDFDKVCFSSFVQSVIFFILKSSGTYYNLCQNFN